MRKVHEDATNRPNCLDRMAVIFRDAHIVCAGSRASQSVTGSWHISASRHAALFVEMKAIREGHGEAIRRTNLLAPGLLDQLFCSINSARLDVLVIHRREVRTLLIDVPPIRSRKDLNAATWAQVGILVNDFHIPKLLGINDLA